MSGCRFMALEGDHSEQFLKEPQETQTDLKRPKRLLMLRVWVPAAGGRSSLTRHRTVSQFIYHSMLVTALKDSRSSWSELANFPFPSNGKMQLSSLGFRCRCGWGHRHMVRSSGCCRALVWAPLSTLPLYPVCPVASKLQFQSISHRADGQCQWLVFTPAVGL